MSSYFTFEGTVTIRRKFKIELIAKNYEEANEYATSLIEDGEDIEQFLIGQPEGEAEIDTYEEYEIPLVQ